MLIKAVLEKFQVVQTQQTILCIKEQTISKVSSFIHYFSVLQPTQRFRSIHVKGLFCSRKYFQRNSSQPQNDNQQSWLLCHDLIDHAQLS